MEQLNRLEGKIKGILEKYEQLLLERDSLKAQVGKLEEERLRLEEALLQKSVCVGQLSIDRETTRNAINSLVESLNALSGTE